MKYIENIDPITLLGKPVWQMSGQEFCALTQYANALCGGQGAETDSRRALVNGVQALAESLGCSPSTIYALMRATREEDGSSDGGGILRDAIVSRIGRAIVFDVEHARELAKAYKNRQ